MKLQGVNLGATLREQQRNFVRAFRRHGYEVGKELTKDIKDKMTNGPQTGRQYKTNVGVGGRALKTGKLVTASAANQYPAVRTGNLRKSIDFKVEGASRVAVGSGAKYAGFLENGTKKIQPRNYLKNTIKTQSPVLRAKASADIKRILNEIIVKY